MVAEWTIRSVGQLGTVVGGSTPSRSAARFWNGDIPWVTPAEMTALGGSKYLDATAECITRAGYESCGTRLLPPRSLLVTSRATLGVVALCRSAIATNQGFKSIVFADAAQSPDFHYHYFQRLKPEMERLASGTTFLEISGRDFASIVVPSPPLPEQRAIAAVLDTLDDAIQKTEQIIAKLKQVKQGLLHDLLTRGIDENGELRDPERHPEQFQDSPLGRIPKGWTIRAMPRMFTRVPPGPRQDERSCSRTGSVPVIDQSEDGVIGLWDGTPGIYASSERPVVTFANHTCAVRWITFDCSAIQNVFFMRGAAGISTRFLYYSVRGRVPQQLYQGHWPLLQEKVFAVPAEAEQEPIVRSLDQLEQRIDNEQKALTKLHSTKAGLAEDLLTGRVRTTTLPEIAA